MPANNDFISTCEHGAGLVINVLLTLLAARLGQHESRRLRLQLLPGREVQQIVRLQLWTGVCTHIETLIASGPLTYLCLINLIHSRTVIIMIDDPTPKFRSIPIPISFQLNAKKDARPHQAH